MTTTWERTNRPKPPRIWGGAERLQYETAHPNVISVYYSRTLQRWSIAIGPRRADYWADTHAEAITLAQQLARKDTP